MSRTRVSGWEQGFGCWEFSDMAWVHKEVEAWAEVAVTFFGYRKIWHASGTCFDTVPLRETLPDVSYTTIAAWVRVPDVARRMCADAGVEFRAGVHAATHAGAFYTKVFHPSFGFNI